MKKLVREPAVAGLFYEKNPSGLKTQLASLFGSINPPTSENPNVQALIVPHAGYVYSGRVAAAAFSSLRKTHQWERIILLGTSHHASFKGAAVYTGNGFATPLGTVDTDVEFASALVDNHPGFIVDNNVHENEHALEVQLPFLQYHLVHPFRIVPILLGSQSQADCQRLGETLAPFLTPNNLWIISTDFSHYPSYADAIAADEDTANAITSNNPALLIEQLNDNSNKGYPELHTSLCGWPSVLTFMYMTTDKDELNYHKIMYENSGDAPIGNKSKVVGYWAISVQYKEDMKNTFSFSQEQKHTLLKWSRACLKHFVCGEPLASLDKATQSGIVNQPLGAFVSFYKKGSLRGCIGRFEPDLPLWQTIKEMTHSTAFNDYRFDSVSPDEINDISIEISVLSPLRPINDYKTIELGRHGVYLKKGGKTGTFLPQVAKKNHWTLEEFLGHLSRDKAGLEWDEWRTAELYFYEAVILKE